MLCEHGGTIVSEKPSLRVLIAGAGTLTLEPPGTVAGCTFAPPAGNGPCVTANWLSGSERVLVEGLPALTLSSEALCVPTGAPVDVVLSQMRVSAM